MSPPSRTRILRGAACGGILGAIVVAMSGCELEAGEGAAYPVVVNDQCMSDEYIATTEPAYFDGRASYLCGGVWYYREGGRWGHYDREPRELHERRLRAEPARRNYEPSLGRRGREPGPRPGGEPRGRPGGEPGGHPGGRPGGHH